MATPTTADEWHTLDSHSPTRNVATCPIDDLNENPTSAHESQPAEHYRSTMSNGNGVTHRFIDQPSPHEQHASSECAYMMSPYTDDISLEEDLGQQSDEEAVEPGEPLRAWLTCMFISLADPNGDGIMISASQSSSSSLDVELSDSAGQHPDATDDSAMSDLNRATDTTEFPLMGIGSQFGASYFIEE
ncbi:hypothetical protein BP6252_07260 [Coleophoma cylindrospora]|uniref:Uncharacterized protein n=1 Tax=Coleophoma cylindrospora TaxID=1849047 RepID=A0A3D8RH21_9HELO|nr:hypothetical protein BP6252_07260 [Coleophoma cylindrospora]